MLRNATYRQNKALIYLHSILCHKMSNSKDNKQLPTFMYFMECWIWFNK